MNFQLRDFNETENSMPRRECGCSWLTKRLLGIDVDVLGEDLVAKKSLDLFSEQGDHGIDNRRLLLVAQR
jgi:hypothetical protein